MIELSASRQASRGARATAAGAAFVLALALAGCSMGSIKPGPASDALASFAPTKAGHVPRAETIPPAPAALAYAGGGSSNGALHGMIGYYARAYDVPERLVHRVIVRESKYNAGARNGPYMGLMQISHATARGMGYRGSAAGLLDAETNLRYAVKYLAGAYITAGRSEDRAMRFYASGYYYDAKRQGLLEEAGLR